MHHIPSTPQWPTEESTKLPNSPKEIVSVSWMPQQLLKRECMLGRGSISEWSTICDFRQDAYYCVLSTMGMSQLPKNVECITHFLFSLGSYRSLLYLPRRGWVCVVSRTFDRFNLVLPEPICRSPQHHSLYLWSVFVTSNLGRRKCSNFLESCCWWSIKLYSRGTLAHSIHTTVMTVVNSCQIIVPVHMVLYSVMLVIFPREWNAFCRWCFSSLTLFDRSLLRDADLCSVQPKESWILSHIAGWSCESCNHLRECVK